MVSARISEATMGGIKILQSLSHDKLKIVQIISQLVHSEIMSRDLAVFCYDGYHVVGDTICDSTGYEFKIIGISNKEAHLIDTNGSVSSISVDGGAAWRMRGASK